jgi:hypothetical protein
MLRRRQKALKGLTRAEPRPSAWQMARCPRRGSLPYYVLRCKTELSMPVRLLDVRCPLRRDPRAVRALRVRVSHREGGASFPLPRVESCRALSLANALLKTHPYVSSLDRSCISRRTPCFRDTACGHNRISATSGQTLQRLGAVIIP